MALDKNPDSAETYFSLATVYNDKEDYQQAIHYFKRSLQLDPATYNSGYYRRYPVQFMKEDMGINFTELQMCSNGVYCTESEVWFHHLTYRHTTDPLDYLLKTLDLLNKEKEGLMANKIRENLRAHQRMRTPGSGSRRTLCLGSEADSSVTSQSGTIGTAPQ